MNEAEEAIKSRREHIMDKLDYAIGIFKDLEKNPELLKLHQNNFTNVKNMLIEIEEEVKGL